MKSGNFKRALALLLSLILTAGACALTASCTDQAAGVRVGAGNFFEGMDVSEVKVYKLSGDSVCRRGESGVPFTPVENVALLLETSDAARIEQLVRTFDGWDAGSSAVPAVDSICDIVVCLGDAAVIELGADASKLGVQHFGRIYTAEPRSEEKCFDLPSAFADFIAGLE